MLNYLTCTHVLNADAIERLIKREAGPRSVSKMKILCEQWDELRYQVVVDVFVYEICEAVGALAAVFNGLSSFVLPIVLNANGAPS